MAALCRGRGDSPQHRHVPTLIDKCVGSFKFHYRMSRDWTNGLTSLSKDGVTKEGLPKFNPRPGRGLNPGTSGWQSEILPTAPTSLLPIRLCVCVTLNSIQLQSKCKSGSCCEASESCSNKL